MSIREEISNLLGVSIGANGWDYTFEQADRLGKVNQRVILNIILILLKRVEQYESEPKPDTTL